jgi:hypothetical protein
MKSIGQKFGIFAIGFALGGATVGVFWLMDGTQDPTLNLRTKKPDAALPENAAQPRQESTSFESKATERVKALFRECGSSSFTLTSSLGIVYEVSGITIQQEEIPLTETDRASGTVWSGTVDIQGIFRTRCFDRCSAGTDWEEATETIGIFLEPQTVTLKADGWHTSLPFDKPDDSWTCERLALAAPL